MLKDCQYCAAYGGVQMDCKKCSAELAEMQNNAVNSKNLQTRRLDGLPSAQHLNRRNTRLLSS